MHTIWRASSALRAIPFTHPFPAARHLFFGNCQAVWLRIGWQLLWLVEFVLIAARIFSSDRILTMRLDLRRDARATF